MMKFIVACTTVVLIAALAYDFLSYALNIDVDRDAVDGQTSLAAIIWVVSLCVAAYVYVATEGDAK